MKQRNSLFLRKFQSYIVNISNLYVNLIMKKPKSYSIIYKIKSIINLKSGGRSWFLKKIGKISQERYIPKITNKINIFMKKSLIKLFELNHLF